MAAAYDVIAKNMKTQYPAQQPETMYCVWGEGVHRSGRLSGAGVGAPRHLLEPVGEPHLLDLGELVADHLDLLGRIE